VCDLMHVTTATSNLCSYEGANFPVRLLRLDFSSARRTLSGHGDAGTPVLSDNLKSQPFLAVKHARSSFDPAARARRANCSPGPPLHAQAADLGQYGLEVEQQAGGARAGRE
jgi:hypothetical protein